MKRENVLIDELKICVSDWGDDFDIDVEEEYKGGCYIYFSVIITHKQLGEDCMFGGRVSDDDTCEMDFTDGCWVDVDKGNLFSYMWFKEACVR